MASKLTGSIFILLIALVCGAQARQIRINRYTTVEVPDDDDDVVFVEVAEVKEVQPTGYPPAGQRPGRAFPLPGEEAAGADATTTELPADLATTTAAGEVDSTTLYNEVPAELNAVELAAAAARQPKAPYPAAGYKPRIPFDLPSESRVEEAQASAPLPPATTTAAPAKTTTAPVEATTITTETPLEELTTTTGTPLAPFTTTTEQPTLPKAPYPAAGFRPSRAFLLPTELKVAESSAQQDNIPAGNTNHPACGVSTNPLHPLPAKGATEDPDAERVLVSATLGPALISAPVPRIIPVRPLLQFRSRPLVAQPLFIAAPGRPFAYSAQYQSW